MTVSVAPASYGSLRLALHVRLALEQFHVLGFSDKDVDDVKGIFADTNLYLLSATVLIASCHVSDIIHTHSMGKASSTDTCRARNSTQSAISLYIDHLAILQLYSIFYIFI